MSAEMRCEGRFRYSTVVTANNNSAAANPNAGGADNATQFPNVIGNPHLGHATIQNWYNVAAFAQPVPGTFGDEGRNSLVGPDLSEIDFWLGKNFALREGIGLQFRIDGYNIFNHSSFALPNTGVASRPMAHRLARPVSHRPPSGLGHSNWMLVSRSDNWHSWKIIRTATPSRPYPSVARTDRTVAT